MKNTIKLAILVLSLLIASGTMTGAQNLDEGNIPIGGIFVTGTDSPGMEFTENKGTRAQSLALAGLMVSVFIIIGAGRAYGQLHNQGETRLVKLQQQRAAIIHNCVKIHDNDVIQSLTECEALETEIADLDYQLNQIKQGV